MGETAEQAKARFAAKDALFESRKKLNRWPLTECETCRHYACTGCGATAYRPSLSCGSCGQLVVQWATCCKSVGHHVGDCCTHCGNDERKL